MLRGHNLLVLPILFHHLLASYATTQAAAAAGDGSSSSTCRNARSCPAADGPQQRVFPSGNEAHAATGKQLHDLLLNETLVVLFHLPGDPHSDAMKPVFECLPAFFGAEVQFVTVAYGELSLMTLMGQGLHALPVLQVNAKGRKYRYSGNHVLGLMLQFVAKATGTKPLLSLQKARRCAAGGGQQGQAAAAGAQALPRTAAGEADALEGDAAEPECAGTWHCARWDGEVTAEELRSQRRGPLFQLSVAFLGMRAAWWLWQRSRRRQPGPAAPEAAHAAGNA